MVEFRGQTMSVELQIRNKLLCLSLDLVVRVHILLCHNFSMQPCCAVKEYETMQKKPWPLFIIYDFHLGTGKQRKRTSPYLV